MKCKAMATLQIRDVPDPLHQLLQQRARQHHRSLSQQALSDLQQACGGDPRERRRLPLPISRPWPVSRQCIVLKPPPRS